MDPVCHTLVGASLGATGLSSKTRYGCATLLIAANLPDMDAVLYFFGDARSYAFRRGITHGIPAIILLAVLLALLMAFLSRMSASRRPGRETSLRWLLVLSLIGVASHPALDWLNNYGMRWLMPMVDTWSYGDTLFIVDPVVWLGLAAGLLVGHRSITRRLRWFQRPASLALAFVVCYISMSYALTQSAERVALEHSSDEPPRRLMAAPVPFNPLKRDIVFDYGTEYRFGTIRFGPGVRFAWDPRTIAKGDPGAFERARQTRDGRWFLRWARFPYVVVERMGDSTLVRVADARYVRDIDAPRLRGFGVVSIEL